MSVSSFAALAAPLPQRRQSDPVALLALLAGFLALYVPTFVDWASGVWAAETQGHELLIVAVSAWLLWRMRHELLALPAARSRSSGLIPGPLSSTSTS